MHADVSSACKCGKGGRVWAFVTVQARPGKHESMQSFMGTPSQMQQSLRVLPPPCSHPCTALTYMPAPGTQVAAPDDDHDATRCAQTGWSTPVAPARQCACARSWCLACCALWPFDFKQKLVLGVCMDIASVVAFSVKFPQYFYICEDGWHQE